MFSLHSQRGASIPDVDPIYGFMSVGPRGDAGILTERNRKVNCVHLSAVGSELHMLKALKLFSAC